MSEHNKEEELIYRLIEEINYNNRVFDNEEISDLIIDCDTCCKRTPEEYLEKIKDQEERAKQFLIACYKIYEILEPCNCDDVPYIKDLVNILWILEKKEDMTRCSDNIQEILGITENHLKALYYILDHHRLIEHAGNIINSWIDDKGYYILNSSYRGKV